LSGYLVEHLMAEREIADIERIGFEMEFAELSSLGSID